MKCKIILNAQFAISLPHIQRDTRSDFKQRSINEISMKRKPNILSTSQAATFPLLLCDCGNSHHKSPLFFLSTSAWVRVEVINNICPGFKISSRRRRKWEREEVGEVPFLKFTWTCVQKAWRWRAALKGESLPPSRKWLLDTVVLRVGGK